MHQRFAAIHQCDIGPIALSRDPSYFAGYSFAMTARPHGYLADRHRGVSGRLGA